MTICSVFNKHQNELFDLMQDEMQFNELHNYVITLLRSDDLSSNKDAETAITIFNSCKKKGYYNYLTTLGTYLTCLKVN